MGHMINPAIQYLVERLRNDQYPDGAWRYPFESGTITDCYMIILLRTLEINEEELIKSLVKRILSKQEKNGAWKLFYDEGEGNINSTIEAYCALLYSGYKTEHDSELQKAKQFIVANGGINHVSMFTKVLLAIIGVMKWPDLFPIPVEVMLLPTTFPVNYFDLSIYTRANLTPILILADKKFHIKKEKTPNLKGLMSDRLAQFNPEADRLVEWKKVLNMLDEWIDQLAELPDVLHEKALMNAEQYMLRRIEFDGTFLSYFSSTFYMIYALLARGYDKGHPIIQNAVKGLKNMACKVGGNIHMQYTTSTVWNTSLITMALQLANIDFASPMVQKATGYLLKKQHERFGDWAVHNWKTIPGGWGFSESNMINPDVDDTTATLRAIRELVKKRPLYRGAWDRGLNWVLSMQNEDGGWPAFERNVDKKFLHLMPISKYLLLDPSTADLTGRTLEFLGNDTMMNKDHKNISRGVKWLLNHQETDGSWYGRWGICYIYGTWAALTGMAAVGVSRNHPAVKKAIKWLVSIQNEDGGFGESCKSDKEKKYVPLGVSTLTHTAWALEALLAYEDKKTDAIEKAVQFLVKNIDQADWTIDYPKGQGLAGEFYMHYHSYRYIWPLISLSKYRRKFA